MANETLNSALLEAQGELPKLHRGSKNPHYGNTYVSLDAILEAVLPVLNEHGLVVSQMPTYIEANGSGPAPALRTRITHAESGECVEDTMLLLAQKDDPQAQGSAITYARRYALMAMLGLVADEDDDGNRAAPRRRVEGEVDGKQLDRPITEAQRKVIFGKARGLDIDYALIPRIIRYATKGRLRDADAVETNGQLDYVLGQLLAFSKQPEAALAAIEKYELESGSAAEQAVSGEPELPTGAGFEGATSNPPFDGGGIGGDEDIPFAVSIV